MSILDCSYLRVNYLLKSRYVMIHNYFCWREGWGLRYITRSTMNMNDDF